MSTSKKKIARSPEPLSLWKVIQADWAWWLSGAILSFFLASILMTGWSAGFLPNLDYPYTYTKDGLGYSWIIQRLIEGWVFDNPRSGYPFGSNFLDFPGADSSNYLILKLIASLTGEFYSTLNLYFLLGFSVTFAVSFCVLRALGLNIPLAFSAAILFNFSAFHFLRLVHLFYTWYFVVPIFYYIAYKIYLAGSESKQVRPSSTKMLLYAFCFILLGTFGIYYALFGIIIMSVVFAAGLAGEFNPEILKKAFLVSLFVTAGVMLNLLPNILHWQTNGPNIEAAQRSPAEAEIYSLKLTHLVLPRAGHRNEHMAQLTSNYSSRSILGFENSIPSLGVIGTLGLFSLFTVILAGLSGRTIDKTLALTSLIVLVLFMFGTTGGFGSIFSQLITSSIRGWNRISIFISFGALLGFFLILQAGLRTRLSGRYFVILSWVTAILLIFVGLYDQTVPADKLHNEQVRTSFNMDRTFIHEIENSLPAGSAIYQLPYMPFPEVPPLHRLQAYGLATAFFHSTSLRWSYAGMKGRDGDLFYRSLSREPFKKQLEIIENLGFAGVYIDRRGFADNGNEVINELTSVLGSPATLVRADGEIVFFRLEQKPGVDIEGLSASQIMQKAAYIVDHSGPRHNANLADGIDFTHRSIPLFVKNIKGLSSAEPWGRWSDANLSPSVRIDLKEQLPNRFTLVIVARPYGPNTGRDLAMKIGSQTHKFTLHGGDFEYRSEIDLQDEKVTRIEFLPPAPASPEQFGRSMDSRKLGIGLVRLRIEE